MSTFGASPFGTSPFSAPDGGGAPPPPPPESFRAAAGSVAFADTAAGASRKALTDVIGCTDAAAGQAIDVMREVVRMSDLAYPTRNRMALVTESVRFADLLGIVWRALAADGVDFVGSVSDRAIRIARLVDVLAASGVAGSRKDAFAAIATVIAINGLTANGWKVDVVDSVAFQEALTAQLRVVGKVLDGIEFAEMVGPSLRITAVARDDVRLGESLSSFMEVTEALREDVLFYTTLRTGNGDYAGWVLTEGAASEYRNYPFNGFAEFDGRYFGTADDGLYLLEGDDDAGTDIRAHIKTQLMDFGTGVNKRLPEVFVAMSGGNTVVLKVITTNQRGARTESIYTAAVPAGDSLHNVQIKVGQGLVSRYWQFELSNANGDDLDIDEIAFRPLMLDRRV